MPMIDVSVDNAIEFTHISSYMKSSFGVWLFTASLSELHLLVYLGISIRIKIVKSKIFKFIFN